MADSRYSVAPGNYGCPSPLRWRSVPPDLRYAGIIMTLLFLCMIPSFTLAQASPESGISSDPSFSLFPTVGGEIFYVEDEQNLVNFYKLIPVGDDQAREKLASYLATILRDADAKVVGDMTVLETILEFIRFDEENRTYVFISSKSEEIVTKEPCMNDRSGDIWFDMEGILPDTSRFVSIWAFSRKRSDDFRIVLRMSETARLEMGRYTLLPEEFKTGTPYDSTHHPFRIHAFGEYYCEPFVQMLPQECDTFTTVDFKSYVDSISVNLGSMFGFRYEVADSLKEGTYTFRTIRPVLPESGGDTYAEHFEERACIFEEADDIIWEFEKTEELVPGTWTMQIMDGGRTIFEKKFFISILLPKTK